MKTVVVALGGNAIYNQSKRYYRRQRYNVKMSAKSIVKLIQEGYRVVVAHDKDHKLVIFYSKARQPEISACYAIGCMWTESQGLIGYMIQKHL